MYSTAIRPKPTRRKIHLWSQADTLGIKDDLTDLADSVIVPDDIDDTTWENIKRKITETIKRRVQEGSKMTTSRYTNPWMNSEIKRAIRLKQRAYRKARLTKKKTRQRPLQETAERGSVQSQARQQGLPRNLSQ